MEHAIVSFDMENRPLSRIWLYRRGETKRGNQHNCLLYVRSPQHSSYLPLTARALSAR